MSRVFHVYTSITGLENLNNYQLAKMAPFIEVCGKPLRTANEVRKMLKDARKRGLRYLPSKECHNYDSEGKCLGCQIKDGYDSKFFMFDEIPQKGD